jgi:hypothetical protein
MYIPFIIGIVVIFVIGSIICLFPKPTIIPRMTVVVASSPLSVVSWDTRTNSFDMLIIPSTYVVNATRGYGTYSLDALWKLGFMDKRGGSLLAESLSETLGVPVPWYIGEKAKETPAVADVIAYDKSLLSLTHSVSYVLSSYQTNIPFPLFVSFVRAFSSVSSEKISVIDFATKSISQKEDLPDGTVREVMNQEDIDRLLKGVFEDETIRKEGLSIAIYNTTSTPNLGNRAARLLSSYGMLVVSVGNNEKEVSDCTLFVDKGLDHAMTVRVIQELFSCRIEPNVQDKRADIEMYIGTQYADLFTPPKP